MGLCMYDRKDKIILSLYTADFWGAIRWLEGIMANPDYYLGSIAVVIEDSTQNKTTHRRGYSPEEVGTNDRKAQNIGSNKRDTQLITQYVAQELKLPYVLIKPTASKWTEEYFKQVTGYPGRTSAHARDAIRLVYGR